MEKMTIRKMLERTVVATNKREVKNIFLVSTDGEIVKAEFAVDLIQKKAGEMEFPVGSERHFREVLRRLFHRDL